MLKYWIVFAAALISSVVLIFFLNKLSVKYKILKLGNISLVGGLGIGLAFIFSLGLSLCLFELAMVKVLVIAGTCLLMLFLGIIDDLKELSIVQKFLAQSFCAVVLISFGIRTDMMFLGFWGNAWVTYFWIIGLTNAFNLLDILDGLAAGIVLIVSSAFLLIGVGGANINVQIISLILCASSLGFLIFNFPPARVYLGNSGSHFLGLLMACLALIAQYASTDNVFALLSPLMILGLPIVDTLLLVIFRVIKNQIPFDKSKDHLALKINALGFSPIKTIIIMYLLCFVFASCGVVLTRVNNLSGAGIIIAAFLFSVILFFKMVKIQPNA